MYNKNCLEALKTYNDWCEEADTLLSKTLAAKNVKVVPRELADNTISSLANEVLNLQRYISELLKEESLPSTVKIFRGIENSYAKQARNEF